MCVYVCVCLATRTMISARRLTSIKRIYFQQDIFCCCPMFVLPMQKEAVSRLHFIFHARSLYVFAHTLD